MICFVHKDFEKDTIRYYWLLTKFFRNLIWPKTEIFSNRSIQID